MRIQRLAPRTLKEEWYWHISQSEDQLKKFGREQFYQRSYFWRSAVPICYADCISWTPQKDILTICNQSYPTLKEKIQHYDQSNIFVRFWKRFNWNVEQDRKLLYYAETCQHLALIKKNLQLKSKASELNKPFINSELFLTVKNLPRWLKSKREKLGYFSSQRSIFKSLENILNFSQQSQHYAPANTKKKRVPAPNIASTQNSPFQALIVKTNLTEQKSRSSIFNFRFAPPFKLFGSIKSSPPSSEPASLKPTQEIIYPQTPPYSAVEIKQPSLLKLEFKEEIKKIEFAEGPKSPIAILLESEKIFIQKKNIFLELARQAKQLTQELVSDFHPKKNSLEKSKSQLKSYQSKLKKIIAGYHCDRNLDCEHFAKGVFQVIHPIYEEIINNITHDLQEAYQRKNKESLQSLKYYLHSMEVRWNSVQASINKIGTSFHQKNMVIRLSENLTENLREVDETRIKQREQFKQYLAKQEELAQERKDLKTEQEQLTQESKSLEAKLVKLVKQQEELAQENQDLRTQLQQENQNLEAKLVKQQEALAQDNQGLRAQLQQEEQELRAQLQQEKQSLEAKISKQQEQLEFLMKHLSGLPQPIQPAAVSEEKAPLALRIPLPSAVPILDPQPPLAAESAPFPAVSLAQNNQHLFAILNLAPAQSHPKNEPTAAPCSP